MPFDLSRSLQRTITKLGPLPSPSSGFKAKRGLSQHLSDFMAEDVADALGATGRFPGVVAGTTTKQTWAATSLGFKSFDVQWPVLGRGIALGISIKNVGAPETTNGGYTQYTHNYKRVSEEWSLETLATHRFQPFATLVGVLFLPGDSLSDRPRVTSFESAVTKFAGFTGRTSEQDYPELLEAIYIGVYINNGPHLGFVRFWDVSRPLPADGFSLADFCTFEELVELWDERIRGRYRRIPTP
jgi:hypothetical protein